MKNDEGVTVSGVQSSLIISLDELWLACSPDGIIFNSSSADKGLLEVKCPHRCSTMSFRDAARQPSFCLKYDEQVALKTQHQYYYQVQHGLFVTGMRWADFVVWSPRELFVQRVERDDDLVDAMLPRLRLFYECQLLPALYAEAC